MLDAASQYEPLGHAWHASALVPPSLGLKLPASHGCAVPVVLLAGQKWPAAHGPEHCASVCDLLAPNRPAGHCSGLWLPLVQNEPIRQSAQPAWLDSPPPPPNLPASHGKGVEAPSAQWWPGMHISQLDAFAAN